MLQKLILEFARQKNAQFTNSRFEDVELTIYVLLPYEHSSDLFSEISMVINEANAKSNVTSRFQFVHMIWSSNKEEEAVESDDYFYSYDDIDHTLRFFQNLHRHHNICDWSMLTSDELFYSKVSYIVYPILCILYCRV